MSETERYVSVDATCEECGARSRTGYRLPTGGCPESFNGSAPHDWVPTSQLDEEVSD